ncbi:methyltransferase domain-containing protein [Plectonema cf. radiosum LEGE 06105]|uniref:Methyltransferase domain-containing protein n=1 Tax=Plectonema cf. radiosum LEGE 06105 TaxID=945769 RepID=A0A8J7K3J6_9CYAN|nr:class I SAM-dependent methyltransferase [Plectonema radiosum]MBE9214242.1 methyltransferase domain-containing protein [Plectonema cf. radiosum LEGE 06105]
MSETNNEITPLHTLNPLHRFSDRVEDYVKYRPSYPEAAIDKILENFTLPIAVADVGAGTGISARQLASRGVNVIAIEPNAAMRNAAESNQNVEWKNGTAEATNLPDASVDLITCFQAFHWFTPEPTLAEFRRILKPSGRLAVVWNNRDKNDEFTAEYSRIIRAVSNNHPAESRMKSVEPLLETPYFNNIQEYNFVFQQELDKNGLIGRAKSSSYVPNQGEVYEQVVDDLEHLYQRFKNQQGFVYMSYSTSVHLGEAN